jgi:hypothetical protein
MTPKQERDIDFSPKYDVGHSLPVEGAMKEGVAGASQEGLAGLFNIYTRAHRGLIFSARIRVVKAMQKAMMEAEEVEKMRMENQGAGE